MLDTGIRVKEATGLQHQHFHYDQKTVTVPGHLAKNGHARVLPLSQQTAQAIHELIHDNQQFVPVPSAIFVTQSGGYLQPSMVRANMKKYGVKAGSEGVRVSPHTFRHTFAKFYILNGGMHLRYSCY